MKGEYYETPKSRDACPGFFTGKRHYISDKFVIGIDPDRNKHQAMVLDPKGIPVGKSFSFQSSYNGFHFKLWQKLKLLPFEVNPENTAFAVEISINYWQKICHYLSDKGYTVLMVRPITTKHERPRLNNFSKTDPKACPELAEGMLSALLPVPDKVTLTSISSIPMKYKAFIALVLPMTS